MNCECTLPVRSISIAFEVISTWPFAGRGPAVRQAAIPTATAPRATKRFIIVLFSLACVRLSDGNSTAGKLHYPRAIVCSKQFLFHKKLDQHDPGPEPTEVREEGYTTLRTASKRGQRSQ